MLSRDVMCGCAFSRLVSGIRHTQIGGGKVEPPDLN